MSDEEPRRLAEFARAVRDSTLTRLRSVPPGGENRRFDDESMSFADLAYHIAEADHWLFAKLNDPSRPAMSGRSHVVEVSDRRAYEALLEELEQTGRRRVELIASMTADLLARELPDERFGGTASVWWIIVRGNLDHEIHHRGQIAALLAAVRREESA
jgi:uncharacterized damage-inducible protein DinB